MSLTASSSSAAMRHAPDEEQISVRPLLVKRMILSIFKMICAISPSVRRTKKASVSKWRSCEVSSCSVSKRVSLVDSCLAVMSVTPSLLVRRSPLKRISLEYTTYTDIPMTTAIVRHVIIPNNLTCMSRRGM